MSLAETSLWAVVKRQYMFKLQSYANLFVSLVIVQLIALLFTLGGMSGTSSMCSDNMCVVVKSYSGTGIFIFTALSIAVSSFVLALPLYRNIDFSFVTNRLSSNLANIGFLITVSIAGGVTATLGSILLRNILYYTGESGTILSLNFQVEPGELLSSLGVAILYLILLSAAGYFAGVLTQLHRSLYVLLPALLLGIFFYESANEHIRIFRRLDFFTLESSPIFFFLKIMIGAALLWIGAILLSDRTEVR
ncbi:MAG: hypothetical protein GX866_01075 [Firmicutes bacterium]|nr:hypothetical protein [Bacillota bacterium]